MYIIYIFSFILSIEIYKNTFYEKYEIIFYKYAYILLIYLFFLAM